MRHFDQWLEPFWKSATPGLCFEVYSRGEKIFNYEGGEFYPFYDLASLTKILFTVPTMMLSMARGKWNQKTSIQDCLSLWPEEKTKIVELMTHTSGLNWWEPFYKELILLENPEKRWKLLQEKIYQERNQIKVENNVLNVLSPKAVYSDLGFLTLAFIMETQWNLPLIEIWNESQKELGIHSNLHWRPMRVNNSHEIPHIESFNGKNYKTTDYAPTELCPWRGRRIQGEVHDENAWSLGGVSSHAGLFGSCSDVAAVFLKLREIAIDKNHLLNSTLQFFMKRQIPSEQGDWALGFNLPTPGSSSSGQYFSPNSLGHTGFTGTSVWWDPENDFLVILLSNRLFYGREQRNFAKLRPLLHDEIVRQFRK